MRERVGGCMCARVCVCTCACMCENSVNVVVLSS